MKEMLSFLISREREEIFLDGTKIFIEILDPLDFHTFPVKGQDYGGIDETAIHEAEHAVVAIEKGVPVLVATIIPEHKHGRNTAGHVITENSDDDTSAIISASSYGRPGSGSDRTDVEREHGKGSFEKYGQIATGIISKNKKKVERVANALMREKKLTGDKIQKVMNQSNPRDIENACIRVVRPDGREEVFMRRVKKGNVLQASFLSLSDLPRENGHSVFETQRTVSPPEGS